MTPAPTPPRWLSWLVARVSPPEDRPFVLSDLEEEFVERVSLTGLGRARIWYARQVSVSVVPLLTRRLRLRRGVGGSLPVSRPRRRSPAEWWSDLLADARFALRSLRRDALVVVVTVVSIGLGVGVVTAVFAVANAVLLAPPGAVADPAGLVAVHTADPGGNPYAETSFPDYQAIAEGVAALSTTAAWRAGGLRLSDGLGERRVLVEIVTVDYFDVLGVEMAIGRAFRPEETVVGVAEPVAVISHVLWRDRYGSSPDVVGRVVRLDDREFTIVGVAPEGLKGRFLEVNVGVWVPVGIAGGTSRSTASELRDRADRDYSVIARLAPGSTADRAQAELDNLAAGLREAYPDAWLDERGERGFTVLLGADARLPPQGRAALAGLALVLMAGGGFVLLIACINVAGLLLARGDRRRKEIAVRLSMGADRRRILRLLFVESFLLVLGSSAAGLALTAMAARRLGTIPMPMDVPIGFTVRIDPLVAVFALGVASLASLAFGLLPALSASRPDLLDSLKGKAVAARGRRGRVGLRKGLVGVQVAASLVLLVATGLALRSLEQASEADLGIEPGRVAAASASFPEDPALPPPGARLEELLRSLEAEPSIGSAAASVLPDGSPLFAGERRARIVVGARDEPDASEAVPFNAVTPGYFGLLGMPVLRGRPIEAGDAAGAEPVVVVNEAFVRRYWEDGDPIGRTFRIESAAMFDSRVAGGPREVSVVGVVRGVTLDPTAAPAPAFWTSLAQEPSMGEVILHVASPDGAARGAAVLREALRERGLESTLFAPQPYQSIVDLAFAGSRAASRLLAWAGVFSLLLAAGGVFGIVSYTVARRRPEMAVRRALGASGHRIVTEVVLDAMKVVGAGAGVGLAIVALLAPLARDVLWGLPPLDPTAVLGGTLVLTTAALAASWVPARKVAAVEPMDVLHEE